MAVERGKDRPLRAVRIMHGPVAHFFELKPLQEVFYGIYLDQKNYAGFYSFREAGEL
jgi:hypothetical protein